MTVFIFFFFKLVASFFSCPLGAPLYLCFLWFGGSRTYEVLCLHNMHTPALYYNATCCRSECCKHSQHERYTKPLSITAVEGELWLLLFALYPSFAGCVCGTLKGCIESCSTEPEHTSCSSRLHRGCRENGKLTQEKHVIYNLLVLRCVFALVSFFQTNIIFNKYRKYLLIYPEIQCPCDFLSVKQKENKCRTLASSSIAFLSYHPYYPCKARVLSKSASHQIMPPTICSCAVRNGAPADMLNVNTMHVHVAPST